jgi:hypothetical protein
MLARYTSSIESSTSGSTLYPRKIVWEESNKIALETNSVRITFDLIIKRNEIATNVRAFT